MGVLKRAAGAFAMLLLRWPNANVKIMADNTTLS